MVWRSNKNMSKEIKNIFNKAKQVGLTSSEREEMRSSVLLYMSENPVRNAGLRRLIDWESIKSLLQPITFKLRPMHVALIIALLFSGGATVAAERALPGDILYPVKVNVNEEVRSLVSVSNEAQANWDARRAERRLEEAEKLADSGKLNSEIRADLEARFAAHAEAFQARADRIESKQGEGSSFRMNSNFEASLRAHENVLATLADREEGNRSEVLSVWSKVGSRINIMTSNRMNIEASISGDSGAGFENAASGVRNAAENKLNEVENFLERRKESVSANVYADAEVELGLAKEAFVRGDTEMSAEVFGQAFVSYQEAMRLAQQAKLMVAAGQRVNMEAALPSPVSRPSQNVNVEANVETNIEVNGGVRAQDARNNSGRATTSANVLLEIGL
jgi:tetratricopeptide (TPR) repeat protein